jgi:hypothetical protein
MKKILITLISITLLIAIPFFVYSLICFGLSMIFQSSFFEFTDGLSELFGALYFIYLMLSGYVYQEIREALETI